jgi:2-polyprenyl-3-methyl-5-hydroxy-6-metoxy-1,4-benzoquinol methylase
MSSQIHTTSLYAGYPAGVSRISMEATSCCICEEENTEPVAVGEDFEYQSSSDTFVAVRCLNCRLIYLNPRPSMADITTIYPNNYHAFNFSEERFGLVYSVRKKLEASRVLSWCRDLGETARIIDVGCGDGFHLRLLREFGNQGWKLEGVDSDVRAVKAAQRHKIDVHLGSVENLNLPQDSYDLALMIQTIEHVADPPAVLRAVRSLLRPGGSLIIVTDNTDSLDFKIFKKRHWGGYHFPRHWNLFNRHTMTLLAEKVGMEVVEITTAVSPVNWVYSVRNFMVDMGAPPEWFSHQFSLESPLSLSAFTAFDFLNNLAGRGALIRAILRRPEMQ